MSTATKVARALKKRIPKRNQNYDYDVKTNQIQRRFSILVQTKQLQRSRSNLNVSAIRIATDAHSTQREKDARN